MREEKFPLVPTPSGCVVVGEDEEESSLNTLSKKDDKEWLSDDGKPNNISQTQLELFVRKLRLS
jgi:hypothetical protein